MCEGRNFTHPRCSTFTRLHPGTDSRQLKALRAEAPLPNAAHPWAIAKHCPLPRREERREPNGVRGAWVLPCTGRGLAPYALTFGTEIHEIDA